MTEKQYVVGSYNSHTCTWTSPTSTWTIPVAPAIWTTTTANSDPVFPGIFIEVDGIMYDLREIVRLVKILEKLFEMEIGTFKIVEELCRGEPDEAPEKQA